jgi:hypothetical protein
LKVCQDLSKGRDYDEARRINLNYIPESYYLRLNESLFSLTLGEKKRIKYIEYTSNIRFNVNNSTLSKKKRSKFKPRKFRTNSASTMYYKVIIKKKII